MASFEMHLALDNLSKVVRPFFAPPNIIIVLNAVRAAAGASWKVAWAALFVAINWQIHRFVLVGMKDGAPVRS